MSIHDALASARGKLAERLRPFLDPAASHAADGIARDALAAVVSDLSREFVITPRQPLMAVLNAREDSGSTLEGQVLLLEMALATSRAR